MSGCSGNQDCPRCGGKDALQTYSDWKPHDVTSGNCVQCGYGYDTNGYVATLAEVNEQRLELELEPLAELAKPTQEWLGYGQEPRPEEKRKEYQWGDVIVCPVCGGDIDCDDVPEKGKCLKCGLDVEARKVLIWKERVDVKV